VQVVQVESSQAVSVQRRKQPFFLWAGTVLYRFLFTLLNIHCTQLSLVFLGSFCTDACSCCRFHHLLLSVGIAVTFALFSKLQCVSLLTYVPWSAELRIQMGFPTSDCVALRISVG